MAHAVKTAEHTSTLQDMLLGLWRTLQSAERTLTLALADTFFSPNQTMGRVLACVLLILSPKIFLFGSFGALSAELISRKFSQNKPLRQTRLFALNGMFLGLALATVLGPSSQTLLAIGLFAGLGVIFVIAVDRFLKTWDLPPIVFPYCLTFWSFQLLTQASTAWTFIPSTLAASPFEQEWTQALFGSLMGFGQIFFSNDWKTAVAIFLTVMVFARRNAAFIAASALLPSALCFAVLGPHWVITSGLTAFGGVLLAHAHLGGVLPLTPWQIWSLIGVSGFLEVLGVQLAQTLHVYLISGGYVFTFWIARLCIETKQSRSQSAGATMTW